MIRLHIKICEIRNFQNNRISENPNIYFTLKLENDDKAECHKTRIINSNDHLIWNEEIDIYASNSNDSLIILIYFNDSKKGFGHSIFIKFSIILSSLYNNRKFFKFIIYII